MTGEIANPKDPFQVGATYAKKGTNIVYCFLDLYDEVRLVNISHSTVYDATIKSVILKEVNNPYPVDTVPYHIAHITWGDIVDEFKFIN